MNYHGVKIVKADPPPVRLQDFILKIQREFKGLPLKPDSQKHLNFRIEEYCNNCMYLGEITPEFRDGLIDFLKANLKFS